MKHKLKCSLLYRYKETNFIVPEVCTAFSIGGQQENDIFLSGCTVCVKCCLTEAALQLKTEKGKLVTRDRGERDKEINECSISEDTSVRIAADDGDTLDMHFSFLPADEYMPLCRMTEIPDGEWKVGSSPSCQIRCPSQTENRVFFVLRKTNLGYSVRNEGCGLGLFLNTERQLNGKYVPLKQKSFLHAEDGVFLFEKDHLFVPPVCEVKGLFYLDKEEQNSHLVFPKVSRTSRYTPLIPSEEVEVLDPAKIPENKQRNILLTIMPSMMSIMLVIFLRGRTSGSDMVIYSAATMGVGVFTSITTWITNTRENAKKKIKRETDYRAYIGKREEEIQAIRKNEWEVLRSVYIPPATEIGRVEDFSADLFDRAADDADFLHLRTGYGNAVSRQPIRYKKHDALEDMDELTEIPRSLSERYGRVDDIPCVIPGTKAGAIGCLGQTKNLQEMMNYLTLDIVTRQFFGDVELYCLCTETFANQMKAYRLLPHVRSRTKDRYNISCDEESRNQLLEELYDRLSQRTGENEKSRSSWIVIYIESDDAVLHHPVMRFVENAEKLHALFIFWGQFRESLPTGCKYIMRLFTNCRRGVLIDMRTGAEDRLFDYEVVPDSSMQQIMQKLAPAAAVKVQLSQSIPKEYSFLEMMDGEVNSGKIRQNWEKADAVHTLAVPIGISDGAEKAILDVHERTHGPHGLVAGTTGSGKSEVLISYLMALATYYSPEDVTFAIVDFKGGGMAKQLAGLPHLIGEITNLDGRGLQRSLDSIKAELLRRQKLLAEAKFSNINDYLKARKKGEVTQPLPHLILVVDEFAELKAQQPEFMDEIMSTARIGRSLGVHMILSTQKPHGVVNDQILSNTDFHICLRVQTPTDSKDMLGSPLASEIREPGRGYLQVGRCALFQLFQSGYTGGSIVRKKNNDIKPFVVYSRDISGRKKVLYTSKSQEAQQTRPETERDERTQFRYAMDTIIEAFEKSGIRVPSPLCLPPLGNRLTQNTPVRSGRTELDIGVCDMPDRQQQLPLTYDLLRNTVIVGSTQMGKTTLLETVIRAAACTMTAEDINIYIMDFNSGIFKMMRDLAIVGGVVTVEEEEKTKNLMKLLRTEVTVRKDKMLQKGVNSYAAYTEAGYTDIPMSLLIIDNYSVFNELYEEKYGETLTYLLREGPAVGIAVHVTAMQSSIISFRKMCYFGHRIVMHCSDAAEYSNLLDTHNLSLAEIPGRVLTKIDKKVYESQVYLPFEDEKDSLAGFVKEHRDWLRAVPIPEVPAVLTASFAERLAGKSDAGQYVIGMDYATVQPIALSLDTQFELALIGPNASGKALFARRLLTRLTEEAPEGFAKIRIVDSYEEQLRQFANAPSVAEYYTDETKAKDIVLKALETAKGRYELIREEGRAAIEEKPLLVYVFNSPDVIQVLSGARDAMAAINEMNERYSRMRMLFLYTAVNDRNGNYGAPDLIRHFKEIKKALLYENLSTVKLFEFSLQEIRANATPLGGNDAYLLDNGEFSRVKLIDMP